MDRQRLIWIYLGAHGLVRTKLNVLGQPVGLNWIQLDTAGATGNRLGVMSLGPTWNREDPHIFTEIQLKCNTTATEKTDTSYEHNAQ